jgi:ABC-2 type transport system permease protein
MMLRGLTKLTWIEIKVFMREPLGAIGSIVIPVIVFLTLGRVATFKTAPSSLVVSGFSGSGLPALAALLIAINAVLSLVTIISIYREGGILKRLRATPLRPQTILTAHVLVKLILTAATVVLMLLSGKRYFPSDVHVPWVSFTIAVLITTCSILSIGFLIASVVPTARFAQPIGAIVLYPMLGLSGLFAPISYLPPALQGLARALPTTYAVRLLEGVWRGDAWSAHLGDVAALAVGFILCTALSARVFRWE